MSPTLIKDIGLLLTLEGVAKKGGRRTQEADLGMIKNAAMILENGLISWMGAQDQIPKFFLKQKLTEISLNQKTVLPGLVECHTHLVFAGSRAHEFEKRNQGMSYSQIATEGGGILSTVKATRQISESELLEISQIKVDQFIKQGVTTLEVKSGYGLNLETELKQLKIVKKLRGPQVISTFLGAHSKSPDFSNEIEYLNFLIKDVLPKIKQQNLASRVDIFIEKGFFSAGLAQKYLSAAQDLGFELTIHADQLSLSGGSDLAVQMKALSADHVICIGDQQIQNLASSQTVAVLLPAADFYLKCAYPPARKLIDQGAVVALATDFNPGTSPTQDLSFVGMLARIEMKMSLPEVIAAYTIGAATALKLQNKIGSLEIGKRADFVSLNGDWTDLFYQVGKLDVDQTFVSGLPLN